MFCADYVAAFVYHAFFTIGSVNLVGKEVRLEEQRSEDSSDHDVDDDLSRWCSEMMIIIFFWTMIQKKLMMILHRMWERMVRACFFWCLEPLVYSPGCRTSQSTKSTKKSSMYDNYCCRDEKEGKKAASVLVPVAVGLTSGAFRLAVLSISNLDAYLHL